MFTQTEKAYYYIGFGFNILSEFELPELRLGKKSEDQVDIVIEKGNLTKTWNQAAAKDEYYLMEEKRIMFRVPGAAIFLIENGKRIVVSPYEGADEDEVRLFTLGTCMGAILLQRKIYPLHGSAVKINGMVYAIVGESGAGKSTLAAAFIDRGFELVSDDVIAVNFTNEQKPYVIPSYPQQKLWQESLTHFNMEARHFSPLYGRETKYSVPVLSSFVYENLPLGGIFELVKSENEKISIQPIYRLERIHALYRHTYRNFFIKPLGLMDWHFKSSINIINHLSLFQIQRPVSHFTAYEMVSLILKTIIKE